MSIAASTAADALVTTPANPLPAGSVVGSFSFGDLATPPIPPDPGYSLMLSAPGMATGSSSFLGGSLGATLGGDATASVSVTPGSASLASQLYSIAGYSAQGQVKVTYQIEYVAPLDAPGTPQTIHMTTSDLLSAGADTSARATLVIQDSATPTPPLMPPPLGSPLPGGGLGGPPSTSLYNQTDCQAGAGDYFGCFGYSVAPLGATDLSILANEVYDVTLTVAVNMPTQVGKLSAASAEIDPGFTVVGPHSGTLFISNVAGAPEPATWSVMTLGLLASGAMIRRCRRFAQAA